MIRLKEKKLINFLNQQTGIFMDELCEYMQLSERSIYRLINSINRTSKTVGVRINYERSRGYFVVIEDNILFREFFENVEDQYDADDQSHRLAAMASYLFWSKNHLTINDIANELKVSRSTIIRDLIKLEDELKLFKLKLIRKKIMEF